VGVTATGIMDFHGEFLYGGEESLGRGKICRAHLSWARNRRGIEGEGNKHVKI
jgi:hypothetical protein